MLHKVFQFEEKSKGKGITLNKSMRTEKDGKQVIFNYCLYPSLPHYQRR